MHLRLAVNRLDWLSFAVVRSLFVASGNNSVVECDLAKVEVAGSNPVSRSILRSARVSVGQPPPESHTPHSLTAPSPSGKAEVCKTSIPGSNPGGASNSFQQLTDRQVVALSAT